VPAVGELQLCLVDPYDPVEAKLSFQDRKPAQFTDPEATNGSSGGGQPPVSGGGANHASTKSRAIFNGGTEFVWMQGNGADRAFPLACEVCYKGRR
jgi:hypothetical protein